MEVRWANEASFFLYDEILYETKAIGVTQPLKLHFKTRCFYGLL